MKNIIPLLGLLLISGAHNIQADEAPPPPTTDPAPPPTDPALPPSTETMPPPPVAETTTLPPPVAEEVAPPVENTNTVQNQAPSETVTITPRLTDFFADRICPSPVWQGQSYIWKGVTDNREDKIIGVQQKKGETLVQIVANPPLEQVLDKDLRKLFSVCGMKLKDNSGYIDPMESTLSVEIEEFQTGLEKKFLTGKGTAQSKLAITIQSAGQTTQTTEVGFNMESKKMRSKNIKQLEESISELLFETLNQIPKAKQLTGQ